MDEIRKQRLSRQLEAQARSIRSSEGLELAQEIVMTCEAMLRVAAQEVKPLELDDFDRDTLTDAYLEVARHISAYSQAAGLQEAGTLQEGSAEKLEELRQLRRKLAMEQQEQLKTIDELRKSITTLENAKQEYIQEEKALTEAKTGLEDTMSRYTEDKLEQLRGENRALFEKIQKLQADFDRENSENKKKNSELEALQSEIDALPGKLKTLVAEMDRLTAEKKRIEEAEETCSTEKQKQLREQIDALSSQLEADKQAYETLSQRRAELQKSVTRVDMETETLETDAIELINSTIRALRPKLERHQKALEGVRDTSEKLGDSLAECLSLREKYAAWFEADRTPLEKLERVLDAKGNLNLKMTLDVKKCDSMKKSFDQIRQELDKLDALLKEAMQAYGMDKQALRTRAIGKTPV